MTQATSKPRATLDKIGDEGLKALWDAFAKQETDAFRNTCIEMIKGSAGKAETKARFTRILESEERKSKMLKTTTDYLLAGQGLGV